MITLWRALAEVSVKRMSIINVRSFSLVSSTGVKKFWLSFDVLAETVKKTPFKILVSDN